MNANDLEDAFKALNPFRDAITKGKGKAREMDRDESTVQTLDAEASRLRVNAILRVAHFVEQVGEAG